MTFYSCCLPLQILGRSDKAEEAPQTERFTNAGGMSDTLSACKRGVLCHRHYKPVSHVTNTSSALILARSDKKIDFKDVTHEVKSGNFIQSKGIVISKKNDKVEVKILADANMNAYKHPNDLHIR